MGFYFSQFKKHKISQVFIQVYVAYKMRLLDEEFTSYTQSL